MKEPFQIEARSCTLLVNHQQPEHTLLKDSVEFVVPVFQRPYSWEEVQVRKLVFDLASAFLGLNGRTPKEAMFIGTMQLGAKQAGRDKSYHSVIDGQQRLSTFLLLFKVLHENGTEKLQRVIPEFHNRLTTKVSNGAQQAYLEDALNANPGLSAEAKNPYFLVIPHIIEALLDVFNEDEATSTLADCIHERENDFIEFIEYLKCGVYFVIIETCAGLSKTLQIFDAINTSGMDLNGGDIFKLRYYEFLRKKNPDLTEGIFDQISELYKRIDEADRAFAHNHMNIEWVLTLAQHLMINRYDMANILHKDYSGSGFFERVFDTVFRINTWRNFTEEHCDKLELSIEELDRLIDVAIDWENHYQKLSGEAVCMMEFIWGSRYGRYAYLVLLFRYRFGKDLQLTEEFISQLSKIFIAFSILYWKAVIEVHNMMYALLDKIVNADTSMEVIEHLKTHRNAIEDRLRNALFDYEIFHNTKAKGITCRLSAMLEELKEGNTTREVLHSLIFDTQIDIEHVESYNHKDPDERFQRQKEWGRELNRIGNLMVLESPINKSISNEDYELTKRPAYAERSKFVIVHKQAENYPKWNKKLAILRKEAEVKKLVEFLCQ